MITLRRNAYYGYIPDLFDIRDFPFKGARHQALPPSVDWRQWAPDPMDQGELGSCTAHGILGAIRTVLVRSGKKDIPMSRLQLYHDERVMEGTVRSDAGAMIRDGIKVCAKQGVAPEELWPYDISKFVKKPPKSVYAVSSPDKIRDYQRVAVSASAIKNALVAVGPVVIGISVYDSFESDDVARTGVVPMPDKSEQMVGGHCMYAVGYGQRPGYFTVRNSWGRDWGDKGDCYIREEYLADPDLGGDYWVIRTAF